MRKILLVFVTMILIIVLLVSCSDSCNHSFIDGKCSKCNIDDPNYIDPNISFMINEEKSDLTKLKELIINNVDDSLKNNITNLFQKAISDLEKANNIKNIKEICNNFKEEVYTLIPIANGDYNFSTLNQSEKDKILSLLDEYIFRNNLGGIPISKYYTLNLNSTTKEQWIKFFGKEGSICQTEEDKYWDAKPFLSNEYFLKGLSLALPKEEDDNNNSPDFYQIDYSKYEFYNHDLELARKYFALSIEELLPIYEGSSLYPIELKLEIAFGTKTNKNEQLFATLKNNIETAFNDPSVSNGNFVLTVEAWYGEYFGQIYTEKLYNGQFDLSYDKISGSSYNNKYMYYYLLSTNDDLSNSLTINWSIDTNNIEDDCIVYNGYRFNYDALLILLNY